ncbi:MAG: FAD:protein FMN transferase [Verrucomicrobia subdivision 3 bacterium]|nr:FAD:protein FMN transferase [Limisphaerales bacterium]
MTPNETITVAAEAMATRFEVALHGAPEATLRAAAEEALAEITRLEAMLSLYRPTSEIAHLNQRAAYEPVRVSAEVFALLERCVELNQQTQGAFDITLAPLMRCWRFMNDTGAVPTDDAIAEALACTGMQRLQLNPDDTTVQFTCEGVMLDLGSIGKGYALEQAAAWLRENEFENFLIHGGTSTVCARGAQADDSPWRVAVENPDDNQPPLHIVDLKNESLSVSGIGGKSFIDAEGIEQGHVINPRTGRPSQAARVAAVVCEPATESDAWATAFLVDPKLEVPEGMRVLR